MLVQIHLRAAKLGNISPSAWRRKKSNPYAKIVLLSPANDGSNNILGYTEVIHNTLSPVWSTIFSLEHDTNTAWTPLRISIHDSRSTVESSPHGNGRMKNSNESSVLPRAVVPATPMGDDGKMGEIDLEVGDVLSMEGGCEREFKLNEGGSLFVHITPSNKNPTARSPIVSGLLTSQIRGLDFKNIESGILGLGAIDPYFELSKRYHDPSTGNSRWQLVYRSEYIHNIVNPYWDAFQLDLEKLCHGDLRRELKITVYDYEKKSAHRWFGEADVTVEELMESVTKGGNASRENALRVIDRDGDVVGLLVVLKADVS
ncbi:hypothetical protein ACHAXN_002374 [Cyclotella atomus]